MSATTPGATVDEPHTRPVAPASFYCIVGGNDAYWRVEAPARATGAKVVMLPEHAEPSRDEQGRFNGRKASGYYSVTQPNDDTDLPWRFLVNRNDPDDWEIEFPEHEGVAIWTRPDLARATLAKAMREKLGIRTICEVDDNYLGDPNQNVYLRFNNFGAQGRLDHLKSHFSHQAIIFSTEWLRDYYWQVGRKELGFTKRSMPEMHVCQNNVARDEWPDPIPRTGPLRVGWMGSPSHVWDVDLAWPALMHARNLGCETYMIGYDPCNPHGSMKIPEGFVFSDKSKEKIAQWAKVGFKHVPWRLPDKYHRMALPLDIGLCPLLHNTYCDGKSDIKFIEYAISGAATVASNTVVYNRTVRHGETGLLVGSPQQMLDAVDLLVRDAKLRERLVANARAYVSAERNEQVMREEWMAAIDG